MLDANPRDYFDAQPDEGGEDLAYGIHWREGRPDEGVEYSPVEVFTHERTGTKVRIFASDTENGPEYSVQPTLGGMDDDHFVVQPEDPGSFLSGGSLVIGGSITNLPEARAVAFMFLFGWACRTSNTGDSEGSIIDYGHGYEYTEEA